MSAVNAQMSRTGLKGDFTLRPLVSDILVGDRHPPPARKDQVSDLCIAERCQITAGTLAA